MSEEIKTILEEIRFKAGIYRDQKRRNEAFNDDDYKCYILLNYIQQKENIIKEIREKVDNFDVFKEFTFPLMKRDEEQQVKSSIDYEWRKSIKEPILEILDKGE